MGDRIYKVANILKDYLPENTKVTVTEIRKANGVVLPAIVIRYQAAEMAPVFYVDQRYDDWPEERIALTILRNYKRILEQELHCFPDLANYDAAKRYLSVRLYNKRMNADLLETMSYKDFLDLAAGVVLILEGEEFKTAVVTDNLLDAWGKSFDEVYAQAIQNLMAHETKIVLVDDVLEEMAGERFLGDGMDLYIMVSDNMMREYGSARMMDTGKIHEFALLHESDIVIIPSSIMEVLLVPVGNVGRYCIEMLNTFVREVNEQQVDQDQWLSDHVYIYRILGGWETNY